MSPTHAAESPEAAVRAALAVHEPTRMLADAELEPVRGGLSNHAWKAVRCERSWFVRLGGPESATLGVDRESERALLVVADAAGLAPELVACDPSNGLLVTRFIPGAPWRLEQAHQLRNIERVAERLRVLHGLEPAAGIRTVDFAAQARRLLAQLHAFDESREPHLAQCEPTGSARETRRAMQLVATLAFARLAARPGQHSLCHNDLHHLNLLDDGDRLWIVDWEYGGVGDPLFDLASFACQHDFSAADRVALADAYGAGSAIPPATLDAACVAFDYVQWLWYLLWAACNPTADGEYALRATAIEAKLLAAAC